MRNANDLRRYVDALSLLGISVNELRSDGTSELVSLFLGVAVRHEQVLNDDTSRRQ